MIPQPAREQEPTLDAAWAAVEAALPPDWTFDALRRGGDGRWRAYADSNQRPGSREHGWTHLDEEGATPVQAMRRLTAALREQPR